MGMKPSRLRRNKGSIFLLILCSLVILTMTICSLMSTNKQNFLFSSLYREHIAAQQMARAGMNALLNEFYYDSFYTNNNRDFIYTNNGDGYRYTFRTGSSIPYSVNLLNSDSDSTFSSDGHKVKARTANVVVEGFSKNGCTKQIRVVLERRHDLFRSMEAGGRVQLAHNAWITLDGLRTADGEEHISGGLHSNSRVIDTTAAAGSIGGTNPAVFTPNLINPNPGGVMSYITSLSAMQPELETYLNNNYAAEQDYIDNNRHLVIPEFTPKRVVELKIERLKKQDPKNPYARSIANFSFIPPEPECNINSPVTETGPGYVGYAKPFPESYSDKNFLYYRIMSPGINSGPRVITGEQFFTKEDLKIVKSKNFPAGRPLIYDNPYWDDILMLDDRTLMIYGELYLNNGTLYVDGNLILYGPVRGRGAIYVSGFTKFERGGYAHQVCRSDAVAIYSEKELRLRGCEFTDNYYTVFGGPGVIPNYGERLQDLVAYYPRLKDKLKAVREGYIVIKELIYGRKEGNSVVTTLAKPYQPLPDYVYKDFTAPGVLTPYNPNPPGITIGQLYEEHFPNNGFASSADESLDRIRHAIRKMTKDTDPKTPDVDLPVPFDEPREFKSDYGVAVVSDKYSAYTITLPIPEPNDTYMTPYASGAHIPALIEALDNTPIPCNKERTYSINTLYEMAFHFRDNTPADPSIANSWSDESVPVSGQSLIHQLYHIEKKDLPPEFTEKDVLQAEYKFLDMNNPTGVIPGAPVATMPPSTFGGVGFSNHNGTFYSNKKVVCFESINVTGMISSSGDTIYYYCRPGNYFNLTFCEQYTRPFSAVGPINIITYRESQ